MGGRDDAVIYLNRQARRGYAVRTILPSSPGATHLFEETGALEQVAELAREWFIGHLAPVKAR